MNPRIRRSSSLHGLLLLAACLLAAQWVGVEHRIEHRAFLGAQVAAQAQSQHGQHGQHSHDGHEPGKAECLLIDHALAQADAWLPTLLLALAALRQAAPEPTAAAAVRAAVAVPYRARGPPETRA